MSKTLAITPLINEKTYELSKSKNVYVFDVPTGANKLEVLKAVNAQFEVSVIKVNTTNVLGKTKRTISVTGKRSVNSRGRRPGSKKAYVTLAKEQSLPFFESIDEAEEKREANQDKFDKAAKKLDDKEVKTQNTDNSAKRRFLRTKKPEGK